MRKHAIGLALATTMLATPALARDGQVYIGLEAGVIHAEDIELDVDTTGSLVIAEPKDIGWEAGRRSATTSVR